MNILQEIMILRLSRLFGVLLLCAAVLFTTCNSQNDYEFGMCYSQNGISQRCEPMAGTGFSFMKEPIVSSTCGTPATDFCKYDDYNSNDNTVVATCGFVCDADSEDNSHPPSEMTDFFPRTPQTWWQSESGIDNVTIQLSFGSLVQVQAISFQFLSLMPDAFYISKSLDHGVTYTPFHYFARDCVEQFMISPQASLTVINETLVLCQSITDPSPRKISFVVDLGRPSGNDNVLGWSNALYEFASATDIEIVLLEHHIVSNINSSDYYYALEDFAVVGKCQCNGHANSCNADSVCDCSHNTAGTNCERCADLFNNIPWRISNGEPFECQACDCNGRADSCEFDNELYMETNNGGRCIDCKYNTTGINCELCNVYYYPQPGVPVNATNYCTACDCNLDGVTNNGDCERNGPQSGQCACKTYVEGRTCDTCMVGHYNLSGANEDGCQECGCHANLSESPDCDKDTGVCTCKFYAIGDKCEECAPGYYMVNGSTCVPCNCDLGGSLTSICDKDTSSCTCRSGVTGTTCSEVLDGYYFPFIDYNTLEAEDGTGYFEYSYQRSNINKYFTGSGFILIDSPSNNVSFGSFTPLISGVYDIVVRYSLTGIPLWEEAQLLIHVDEDEGLQAAPNLCTEHLQGDILLYHNLTFGMGQGIAKSVCLRGGRKYSFTMNNFISGGMTDDEIEIDSLVVLLRQGENVASLAENSAQTHYSDCVNSFYALSTRSNTVLSECRDISFSVFTEIANGTMLCDCSVVGSNNSLCMAYGGDCDCKMNVNGRRCDTCEAGSYELTMMGCTDCSCFLDGSVTEFCDSNDGQCDCLPNIIGQNCDACSDYHYGLDTMSGCIACQCDVDGSVNLQCNNDTGVCSCRGGVTGDKCDVCELLHYGFPNCMECDCNVSGSSRDDCDIVTGQCSCRTNTQGLTCSQCKSNTFNLQSTNPSGCQPCFCSSLSATCTSASGFMASMIATDFADLNSSEWFVVSEGIFGIDQNSGLEITSNDTVYLDAPHEFLGNKLSSYGQYLTVTADIVDSTNGFSDGYDAFISSNTVELVASFEELLIPASQNYTIFFHEEAGWTDLDTGMLITAHDLQSVLFNLEELQVRVSLGSKTVISMITLGSTIEIVDGGVEVDWVEKCDCPLANYTGLSCELCSDGYTRNGIVDTGLCELCQCNGHSDMCDKDSGDCLNCANNTSGPKCNICAENYYGDPTIGIACEPCPCPGVTADEQFSSSCAVVNGAVVCACNEGHIGDNCEDCDVNYFGDPLGLFGMARRCSQCTCNGNIMIDDPNSCNKTTGECLNCLFNTTGDECQFCLEGYYGDPIVAKNCIDCMCNTSGSEKQQCDENGICPCYPNVGEATCDSCKPGSYNFTSGEGCSLCNCDPIGSVGGNCDVESGQCICKEFVVGQQCNQCQVGYYSFDSNGCKACGCSDIGSLSNQCNDDGICTCNTGVTGAKCDQCMDNFYLDDSSMTCASCPACYSDLENDVNGVRIIYSAAEAESAMIDEQNDTYLTFEQKADIAINMTESFSNSVSDLQNIQQITMEQLSNISNDANSFLNEMIPQVMKDLLSAQAPAYTILQQALIAEDVKNLTEEGLYSSHNLLALIENQLLPSIEKSVDAIVSDESVGYEILVNVTAHFDILVSQVNQVSSISSLATNLAMASLNAANAVLVQYTTNAMNFSVLSTIANTLSTNVSILSKTMGVLRMDIQEMQVTVAMLHSQLPILPSNITIDKLQTENAMIDQLLNGATVEIDILLVEVELLNNTLEGLMMQYNGLLSQLNLIMGEIDFYSLALNVAYNDTIMASNLAASLTESAEMILGILENFSDNIKELQEKAEDAMMSVFIIQDSLNSTERKIDNAMNDLSDISDELSQAFPIATQLAIDSRFLNESAADMKFNTSLISQQADSILDTATNRTRRIDELYMKALNASDLLDTAKTAIENTTNYVLSDDVATIASDAQALSSDAASLANNLTALFQSTLPVDSNLLDNVDAYVDEVGSLVNENDLRAMKLMLEEALVMYNNELSSITTELQSIENDINALTTILYSLPDNCDSDY